MATVRLAIFIPAREIRLCAPSTRPNHNGKCEMSGASHRADQCPWLTAPSPSAPQPSGGAALSQRWDDSSYCGFPPGLIGGIMGHAHPSA